MKWVDVVVDDNDDDDGGGSEGGGNVAAVVIDVEATGWDSLSIALPFDGLVKWMTIIRFSNASK